MSIRDEIIAYHQTHHCIGQERTKPLLIRSPLALIEQFNPQYRHLDLFDTSAYDTTDTADYIYLRLYPDYDVENDRLGDKGFRNTFNSGAVFAPANTRRGFKATVRDRRKLVLDIIKRLVDISESSGYNRYSPIKLIDFCHPELDAALYNGEPATIRWGALALDTSLPSLVRVRGEDYLRKDWGFTFKESVLRLN